MTEHPEEVSSHSSPAPRHPVTARTKTRWHAIETLLEADQRGMLSPGGSEELHSFAQLRAASPANHTEAPTYMGEILGDLCDHLDGVDETIQIYVQGRTLGWIPAVDRAITRVVTWEIAYNDEMDASVAVDETMTLSRMLSTDESPRYLGGLLGRIGDLTDTLRRITVCRGSRHGDDSPRRELRLSCIGGLG